LLLLHVFKRTLGYLNHLSLHTRRLFEIGTERCAILRHACDFWWWWMFFFCPEADDEADVPVSEKSISHYSHSQNSTKKKTFTLHCPIVLGPRCNHSHLSGSLAETQDTPTCICAAPRNIGTSRNYLDYLKRIGPRGAGCDGSQKQHVVLHALRLIRVC
jgi:hypothetical protein